jgi:hypothetical protein
VLLCYWLPLAAAAMAAVMVAYPGGSAPPAPRTLHHAWLLALPVLALTLAAVALSLRSREGRGQPAQPAAPQQLFLLLTLQLQDAGMAEAEQGRQQEQQLLSGARSWASGVLQGLPLALGPLPLLLSEVGAKLLPMPGLLRWHGDAGAPAAAGCAPETSGWALVEAAVATAGALGALAAGSAAAAARRGDGYGQAAAAAAMAAGAAVAGNYGAAALRRQCILPALSWLSCAACLLHGALRCAARRWHARNWAQLQALLLAALLLAAKLALLPLPAIPRQLVEALLLAAALLPSDLADHWKLQLMVWDAGATVVLAALQHPPQGPLGAGPLLDTVAIKAAVVNTTYCMLFCHHLIASKVAAMRAAAAAKSQKAL